MWILRACGGGDVKLLAALGAWLGPIVVIRVLGVSIPILFLVVICKTTFGGRRNVPTAAERTSGGKANHPDKASKGKLPQMRIAYSLPIAISLLIVLTWRFRVELGIAI
jgi:prepilin peptidase CpaA